MVENTVSFADLALDKFLDKLALATVLIRMQKHFN